MDEERLHELFEEGVELSPQEADDLEVQLVRTPDDVETRCRLIACYELRGELDTEAQARRVEHVLWLIEDDPRSSVLLNWPPAVVHQTDHPTGHARIREAWERCLAREPDAPELMARFASFLFLEDAPEAIRLQERARQLAPDDRELLRDLGYAYERAGRAAEAQGIREELVASARDDLERFYQLGNLAKSACEAGEDARAEELARELLRLAPRFPEDWNYGNALHEAHTVLGLLALRRGDLERAAEALRRSGDTPGSPQLDTFGPSWRLALEVARAGALDAVIDYLESCSRFWTSAPDHIPGWLAELRAGRVPPLGWPAPIDPDSDA